MLSVRTALFWAIKQRVERIPHRRFETSVPKRRKGIATNRRVIAQNSAVLIYFAGGASNHTG